jgi:hypothetical protein
MQLEEQKSFYCSKIFCIFLLASIYNNLLLLINISLTTNKCKGNLLVEVKAFLLSSYWSTSFPVGQCIGSSIQYI